eukprot:s1457_g9.t2
MIMCITIIFVPASILRCSVSVLSITDNLPKLHVELQRGNPCIPVCILVLPPVYATLGLALRRPCEAQLPQASADMVVSTCMATTQNAEPMRPWQAQTQLQGTPGLCKSCETEAFQSSTLTLVGVSSSLGGVSSWKHCAVVSARSQSLMLAVASILGAQPWQKSQPLSDPSLSDLKRREAAVETET